MIPAAFIGFIVLIAAGLIGYFTETRRVGGIRFWRLGRLGGSFYVAKIPQKTVDRLGC